MEYELTTYSIVLCGIDLNTIAKLSVTRFETEYLMFYSSYIISLQKTGKTNLFLKWWLTEPIMLILSWFVEKMKPIPHFAVKNDYFC